MEDFLKRLTEKGFLASPKLKVEKVHEEKFLEHLLSLEQKPFIVSEKEYEVFKSTLPKEYEVIRKINRRPEIPTKVKIRKNYIHVNKKIDINDWVMYYYDRFNKLSGILRNRQELESATTISRIASTDGTQEVSVIGMIKEIRKTFSGVTIIEIEDPTGIAKVMLKSPEVARTAENLVHDEVIGVIGNKSKNYIFAEKIICPDIPEAPVKKAKEDVYAAFISDTHVGSNMFLPKELNHFSEWVRGNVGTKEQKEVASKLRYLFVVGDLVDGVGIYPGQEDELTIQDIYAQYDEFSKYFQNLPEDLNIIVIPGNHDALRLAEPQHALFQDICESVYKINNITMASNPSIINIHNIDEFPGFDTMLYHGMSFDSMVSNAAVLRQYGYERADKIMEFLLKKRHLAPSHGSTLVNPMASDFLVIDRPVDIFASGHIHYTKIGRYKNVFTMGAGCFQEKTPFQEKLGHNPTPGRVPIMNLRTSEAKVMNFR